MCFHVCMYVYINVVQWSGMIIFGLFGYMCVCECVCVCVCVCVYIFDCTRS